MPFDREVGLVPGDTVRWGSSCPSPKGYSPPIFGPCLLWPNGWMDEGATLYGGRHRPMPHCARRGPISHIKGRAAPCFRPMYIVAKRSPISATAKHLLQCSRRSVFGYTSANWRIRLNLCFLQPTPLHNQNGKSIGLAVSAQLTAESPYTLQWATISPKIVPSHVGIWTPI